MNNIATLPSVNSEKVLAFYLTFIVAVAIAGFIIFIVSAIADYKLFNKAGIAGWKAFVPFYNMYLLCQIIFGQNKGWYFIFLYISPISTIFGCILEYKLGRAYGKDTGFCVLSIFFTPITRLILGFGEAEYAGPQELFS